VVRIPSTETETVYTYRFARVPLGLLTADLPAGEFRVLMAMTICGETCLWSSSTVSAITGIDASKIRTYQGRLVGRGILERLDPKGFRIHPPKAAEETLRALNDSTADRWVDGNDPLPVLRIRVNGGLDVPVDAPAVQVLAHYLPWLLTPSNADAKVFWGFIDKKARALLRKAKNESLEPTVACYLVLRSAVEEVRAHGGLMGLHSPARWIVGHAYVRPSDLTEDLLASARNKLAGCKGGTVADLMKE
jgi:hypothetical protein